MWDTATADVSHPIKNVAKYEVMWYIWGMNLRKGIYYDYNQQENG